MPGKHRLPLLLALLSVLVALSGCGSDEISGEIPQDDAVALKTSLEAVSAAVAVENCDDASSALQEYEDRVDQLPATAGTELKTELREAGDNLLTLVDAQCATDTSGTTPDTTPAIPTDTAPTSSTTEPTTTDTTTTDTTTDTTTTTTDEEPPPGNGGGDDGGSDGGTGGTGGGGTGD